MNLAKFQHRALNSLMAGMASEHRNIVLKSCTGSGKTIILTHFIDEYCKCFPRKVFVWFTPGKGELEEQSKSKMDVYIRGSQTKTLADVMTEGFAENDCCFINWELLVKKGNNALRDSERTNFREHIERALDNNLSFIIIIDESHQNDTIKADDIVKLFQAEKIIRSSATPTAIPDSFRIEIPEEDVIAEGLIKKLLIINEDFEQSIHTDNQTSYLLGKALKKQRELYGEFAKRHLAINPLIVVQLPNNDNALLDEVEHWFESKGITYENKRLAVWLANKKENLDEIDSLDALSEAVVIKQAIAIGWDCPRAYILVKLRENMEEKFEIQTIGRIRRMPEAKHYEDELLDCCFLYTFDRKFAEGAKKCLGQSAFNALKLRLKNEYRDFRIPTQFKTLIPLSRDPYEVVQAVRWHFEDTYGVNSNFVENQTRLESKGYLFKDFIVSTTKSGEITTFAQNFDKNLNDVRVYENLNTHSMNRLFHQFIGEISRKVTIDYDKTVTIVRRLFFKNDNYEEEKYYRNKILQLDVRSGYRFVINNRDILYKDICAATSDSLVRDVLELPEITEKLIKLPLETTFTYDEKAKNQKMMVKNVYEGYLSSAEIRSSAEKKFELFCEKSPVVDWWYKNGDKGEEYFAIVYLDNFGKQKSFYPDYLVSIKGVPWIIETKGGFNRFGQSEDIDQFSPKKFDVLEQYLKKHNFKGGFVREDKSSCELCLCTEEYNDDIYSSNWRLLEDVWV